MIEQLFDDMRDEFRDLEMRYEREALEKLGYSFGAEIPNHISSQVSGVATEIMELADIYRPIYDVPTEDEFFNYLIKAHNMCIKLKRNGFDHPVIDKVVKMADPSVMNVVRLIILAAAQVAANLTTVNLGQLSEFNYWDEIQEELDAMEMINNP